MAIIEVDVDLDEFDTEDLIRELSERLQNQRSRKAMSDKQIQFMNKELKLADLLPKNLSLLDVMKYEEIVPNLWRKSPDEIRSFFTA